ncbi:phosphoribosyl-AMP cyclohydrolase [Bacillus methanolicus]|uniref:Histidine biosynthesis bifunctional protein HisIE n=1 Tax=Bacillus methanolicus (strain MGA3 / ATCC 53907) TaxID=796606 RepID=I3E8V7_BACMM|nr:phosphoribosyl-AMP cyclohydrolase [Bacillus methanolicus]AIE60193.1 bifunctional phosphoribosyl-AMP cyclohydrolase/phosphoribosyl-ATP pyrophosphatase protein [Bacillus methanolicus MGA3]EIJ82928.1 bifunctional phosphoribosyl-AMP cyclohydrolase/phosphoribosyl-ATP pyrophosphatase protein [Bacillus methanolicus MGA3]UQD52186.1 phosphoribosyl-AMP cyclohydrolase [Bacillus methanolicus]
MTTENKIASDIKLDFSKLNGLVPAVLQHAETKEVLMVGFMDEEAWEQTVETGLVTLFRRTLGRVQVKGEEDGKFVNVRRIVVDCDVDTVLLEVVPESPVCHYGYQSCFIKEILPKK